MLSVNHGIVHAQINGPNELRGDVSAIMVAFIKANRAHEVPDEMIEKAFMEMVCDAFEMVKHTETINEDGYFKGGEHEGLDREQ